MLLSHFFHSPNKCEICGKMFEHKSRLEQHYKVVHQKSKDFACAFCDKTFAHKPNLERHQNEVHLKLKFVKCQLCGKEFSREEILGAHVKAVHEKEKKYKCDQNDQCEASFDKKKELALHIKTNHKPKIEKRLECEFCKEHFEFNCHRVQHEINCPKKHAILQKMKL